MSADAAPAAAAPAAGRAHGVLGANFNTEIPPVAEGISFLPRSGALWVRGIVHLSDANEGKDKDKDQFTMAKRMLGYKSKGYKVIISIKCINTGSSLLRAPTP